MREFLNDDRRRKYLYPALAIWAVLLLVLAAYYQTQSKQQPKPLNTQQRAEQAVRAVEQQQQNNLSSRAKINKGRTLAVQGRRAPGFKLPQASGKQLDLASFRGQPTLVEFVASWCPHCRAMAPVLDRVVAKHPKLRYVIVAAAKEPHKTVVKWRETFLGRPMRGALVFDDTLTVARAYGVQGYPTLAFIDSTGILRSLTAGEQSPARMNDLLRSIGA